MQLKNEEIARLRKEIDRLTQLKPGDRFSIMGSVSLSSANSSSNINEKFISSSSATSTDVPENNSVKSSPTKLLAGQLYSVDFFKAMSR